MCSPDCENDSLVERQDEKGLRAYRSVAQDALLSRPDSVDLATFRQEQRVLRSARRLNDLLVDEVAFNALERRDVLCRLRVTALRGVIRSQRGEEYSGKKSERT